MDEYEKETIEKLEPYISRDKYGNVLGEIPPTPWEMTDKINELVEAVNQLEQELEKWKER